MSLCLHYNKVSKGRVRAARELIMKWLMRCFLVMFPVLILSFSADAKITLRMVGPEDIGGAWKEIIHRFHEKHSGIRIDYVSGPWSTDERENMYARSFLGGDPFELVYMDVIWTAKFAKRAGSSLWMNGSLLKT
jgi:ABC-type glycerol-3-phosphate transport system substrate-binding protein